ncbi:uncharacterized protein LOC116052806 [Sander lucioperca]|uniref:uncharacterized protein LOC116052806 n=1 Tax=Sander lucioperca TaxID=283035 RepID=UPI0016534BD5|nr:uncharacterized protein LOC116052806 [Sander lucioperca]
MGSDWSQEEYDSSALWIYDDVLQYKPSLLPDIGIDESLLKYSGTDSNAVLQVYSNETLSETLVPEYIEKLGSTLGALESVPNAVGLGALVISFIIEIIIKVNTQTSDYTYSMIRRVFGEEKASSVRDTMSEYLKRHRMFINNDQRLREELRRLEQQLSNHLTILANSLLHDGQMSSRGFKIWVNGAAFHVQMLIFEAQLNIQTGTPASGYVNSIEVAIDSYEQDLDNLLEKHKTYKINSNMFTSKCSNNSYPKIRFYENRHNKLSGDFPHPNLLEKHKTDKINSNSFITETIIVNVHDLIAYIPIKHYYMQNYENGHTRQRKVFNRPNPWHDPKALTTFMNLVYSNYEPIKGLKSYFLKIKNDLNSLIRQRGSFTLSSAVSGK